MNGLAKAAAIVLSAALLFSLAPRTVSAQPGPPPGSPPVVAPPAAPALPVVAPAPAAAPAPSPEMEKDLQLYWGAKRKVRVVQRRLHAKDSRHEVTAFGGIIPNDPFLFYYMAGARYGYFASESFSLELTYAKPFLKDTDLGSFLEDTFPKIDDVQENDRFQHMAHADLVWTPFYGKMAFLSTKLIHFDLGMFLGAGWLNTQYLNKETAVSETRHTIEGNVGAGFRFHIMDYFTLRFDVHQYFFKKVQGGLSHPTMLSFGLSTLAPYPVRKR